MSSNTINTLTIEAKPPKNPPKLSKRQQETKGRSFQAQLLGYVQADTLWEIGKVDTRTKRPVWIVLAGGEQELRTFIANVRSGNTMVSPNTYDGRYEIMRSAEYEYHTQRIEDGEKKYATARIYLPELFSLHQDMIDPLTCKFIMLIPRVWINDQQVSHNDAQAVVSHLAKLGIAGTPDVVNHSEWHYNRFTPQSIFQSISAANYFAAMLDHHTEKPLVNELPFYVQLYYRFLAMGAANLPDKRGDYGYREENDPYRRFRRESTFTSIISPELGMLEPVMCNISQVELNKVLAHEVQTYFQIKNNIAVSYDDDDEALVA